MNKLKVLLITVFISLFACNVSSQEFPHVFSDGAKLPRPENYENKERSFRRPPLERAPDEPFLLVFIKNFQDDNFIFIELAFNSTLKMESIYDAEIMIDEVAVEKESILFSRDGHRCRLKVQPTESETIDFKIKGICSKDGCMIPPLEIEGLLKNSMYKFNRECCVWQKFSL